MSKGCAHAIKHFNLSVALDTIALKLESFYCRLVSFMCTYSVCHKNKNNASEL